MTNCSLCGSTTHNVSSNHVVGIPRSLKLCGNCGLAFRAPMPSAKETSNYYQSLDYFRYSRKIEKWLSEDQANWILSSLSACEINSGSLDCIEFGCGDGWLLSALSGHVNSTRGYEADKKSAKRAREKIGDIIECSYFAAGDLDNLDIGNGNNTIFILSHVLEHFTSPIDFVERLAMKFPGAFLYIEVPDAKYEVPAMINDQSKDSSMQQHLWSFSNDSLGTLTRKIKGAVLSFDRIGSSRFYDYKISKNTISKKLRELADHASQRNPGLSRIVLSLGKLLFVSMITFIYFRFSNLFFKSLDRRDCPSIRYFIRL